MSQLARKTVRLLLETNMEDSQLSNTSTWKNNFLTDAGQVCHVVSAVIEDAALTELPSDVHSPMTLEEVPDEPPSDGSDPA